MARTPDAAATAHRLREVAREVATWATRGRDFDTAARVLYLAEAEIARRHLETPAERDLGRREC